MKILFVGQILPREGGAALLIREIIHGLAGFGHEIRVLSYLSPGDYLRSLLKSRAYARKIRLHFFVSRYIPVDTVPDESQIDSVGRNMDGHFRRIEKSFKPDVIFISHAFGWFVGLFAKYRIVQLVFGSPVQHLRDSHYPSTLRTRLIEGMRSSDLNVSVSEYVEETVRDTGITKVRTIENGTDTRLFYPREKSPSLLRSCGLQEASLIIGHVSNLRDLKHPYDIIDLASELSDESLLPHFLIIGDGKNMKPLQKAVRRQRLHHRIHFTGWVEFELVPQYLNLIDILLFSSTIETFGRVIRESQALGKVVIARDIKPMNRVIESGKDGILLKDWNIKTVARCIRQMVSNEARRKSISSAAIETAKRFTKYNMIRDYHSLITADR